MKRPLRRVGIAALAILAGLLALAVTLLIRPEGSAIQPGDTRPRGRWHFDPSRLGPAADDAELARVLSLPYVAGTTAAPAETGVVRHDPTAAFQGLNLYVSAHAPEARLVDMAGRPIHRWRFSFERAFPDRQPSAETDFFRRAWLGSNGDLLAIFQGSGMIRLDRDSRLLWSSDLPFFNHLTVTPDGRIFTIVKQPKVIPRVRAGEPVLEDLVVILSPAGQVIERISLLQTFLDSRFAALTDPLPDHADIFHSNTVVPVALEPPDPSYPFREGDLLVSLREVDIVAFIDPAAPAVRQAWRGPWRAQHQPVLLANGRVLLFDNQGLAGGGSRVLEFDTRTSQIVWEYRGSDTARLASPEAGTVQRLPNGNTLITDSERGRALEVTPDGTPVWEFVSPHRAGRSGELVATLFEVVRLEERQLGFLGPPEPQSTP